MLRNYLAAALRNLSRNRLYTVINVVGLAASFTTAILIGLFVRDELSYDRFIPGHEDVYRVFRSGVDSADDPDRYGSTPASLAAWLRVTLSSAEHVARLHLTTVGVRHGEIEVSQEIADADPEFFRVLPLRAFAGDVVNALQTPDGVVLTRSAARRYFDRDAPIGETLQFSGHHRMVVTAVLEDLPSNTHLHGIEVFVSSRAPFSRLRELDSLRDDDRAEPELVATYIRMKHGASLPAVLPGCKGAPDCDVTYVVLPLRAVHLGAPPLHHSRSTNARSPENIRMALALGALILSIAGINFANLMTARAARRAPEVGIRKSLGATRRQLIAQFLGEALLHSIVAGIAAVAASEILLPSLNAFLDRSIDFNYGHDPWAAGVIAALVLLTGTLAGLYPAFVLTAYQPALVLKGQEASPAGSSLVRGSLVVAQFTILTALILATAVMHLQTQFALHEGTRVDKDQVVLIGLGDAGCRNPFVERVTALPGVVGWACSLNAPLGNGISIVMDTDPARRMTLHQSIVDFGYFELYGIRPIAGRIFSRSRATDAAPEDRESTLQPPLILNESAVGALGFATPTQAIGQTFPLSRFLTLNGRFGPERPAPIIGVVPDFPLGSIVEKVGPTVFFIDGLIARTLSVKLSAQHVPGTLREIDRVWKQTNPSEPVERTFFDERLEQMYRDIARQSQVLACCTGIALCLACLGIFGLATFIAERRTKEIGIRKALGATRSDVLRLLIWEFARPVVLANAIGWPLAYVLLSRWLERFAYRIELEAWMFGAAGFATLLIASFVVIFHAMRVSAGRPAVALRET